MLRIHLCLLLLIVMLNTAFSQTPDFTGRWRLNLEKSKLESTDEGFTGSLFIIRQAGNKFKLTRYHYLGTASDKVSFSMKADGKTRPFKRQFEGKLEKRENELMLSIWGDNFSNVVNYRFGNSIDEFIADEVYTGYPKNHRNIWVFDREVNKK